MASHTPSHFGDMREQVLHECSAMARYALASGMTVPPQLMATIETARGQAPDIAALTRAHSQLAKLVAPATPRALLLMGAEHDGPRLSWLGHVGIVRRMMYAAAISILAFIVVSLTSLVNNANITVQTSSGLPLFAMEMFWLSAAAMGASFAMLMQVSAYIVNRTYDPKYEPTYWIKFLLGIMAGFILVTLVPIHQVDGPGVEFAKPTVAMLGGFSASAVFRILTRLVDTVESLFRPSAKDDAAQRERAAQARATEETSQTRISLAGQIVKLQQQAASGADITGSLQQILHSLVPGDPTADAPPAGTIALPNVAIVGAPSGDDAGDGDAGAALSAPTASASAPADEPAADLPDAPTATAAEDEPAAG